jgi:hypothetical protein
MGFGDIHQWPKAAFVSTSSSLLYHRPHNHHMTHWHWQCYVWQPYCQTMHRNGSWNYSKSHILVSMCWTSRFVPLLRSVPLVHTHCLGVQGKSVSVAGSRTSGFFGSDKLDDRVSTRVCETFGMVISVHYPLQFHMLQIQVAYIIYHMNVEDITISLICKPINRSLNNYLIENPNLDCLIPDLLSVHCKVKFQSQSLRQNQEQGPHKWAYSP